MRVPTTHRALYVYAFPSGHRVCGAAVCVLQLWDYDKLSANDRVGTCFLRFADIRDTPMQPTWINIYGT